LYLSLKGKKGQEKRGKKGRVPFSTLLLSFVIFFGSLSSSFMWLFKILCLE